MRFNPDGTVEFNYQAPEYQRPAYEPRPMDKAFARGTGAKSETKAATEAKKVEVKGVAPAKKPRAKGPSRKERTADRDQKIVELMDAGATGEDAGAASINCSAKRRRAKVEATQGNATPAERDQALRLAPRQIIHREESIHATE